MDLKKKAEKMAMLAKARSAHERKLIEEMFAEKAEIPEVTEPALPRKRRSLASQEPKFFSELVVKSADEE